jgi:amino acid permease
MAYVSMTNLIRFSYIAKKDNYARLVEHVLGDKVGIFLHCMFIVYAFGCNVTY